MSPFHVFTARFKARRNNSIAEIELGNFFKADLGDADIVYLFLVKSIVDKAWEKIKKECKKDTIVIVSSDSISNNKSYKKILTRPKEKGLTYYRLYRV